MTTDWREAFVGKRILVTGHTGFKGSWLSLWLNRLGAQVFGCALAPPTTPAMFDLCSIGDVIDHHVADIRDAAAVQRRVAEVRPEVVFHLAAQPIVRLSFSDPLGTFASNVMGTAHVLEAVRAMNRPCAVVVISSDKCYDNRDWAWGYRENDPLGGKDPYSASKGATELVAAAWRDSFFGEGSGVRLASARAGNVIGGGDWAQDRIVPDCINAFREGRAVELRNPAATRPWQHVLEPLGGYLLLASRLQGANAAAYCSGWNFGPAAQDVCSVGTIVAKMAAQWGEGSRWTVSSDQHAKEAARLALNCDKAIGELGWRPAWGLDETVRATIAWYRVWSQARNDLRSLTLDQIAAFEAAATASAEA